MGFIYSYKDQIIVYEPLQFQGTLDNTEIRSYFFFLRIKIDFPAKSFGKNKKLETFDTFLLNISFRIYCKKLCQARIDDFRFP